MDQALVSGSNFLTGILLARTLGLEGFGSFTLAWLVVLFVQGLQHAAINAPMLTLGPQQSEPDRPHYFGGVLVLQLLFAVGSVLAAIVILYGMAQFQPEWDLLSLILPLGCAAFICQIQDFLRRYYFTRDRPHRSLIGDVLRYGGQILGIFLLSSGLLLSMTVQSALWVHALTAAISAGYMLANLGSLRFTTAALVKAASGHWMIGKWLTGSAILRWVSGNLFILASGGMLGVAAAGALKAAQNILGLVQILFQALENYLPVTASRHFKVGGVQALRKFLGQATLRGGVVMTTLVIGFIAFPEFWLALFYGDQYLEFGYVVQGFAVAYLLIYLYIPSECALRTLGRARAIFIATALASVIALASVYTLISEFGIVGALLGIIIVHATKLLVGSRWAQHELRHYEAQSTTSDLDLCRRVLAEMGSASTKAISSVELLVVGKHGRVFRVDQSGGSPMVFKFYETDLDLALVKRTGEAKAVSNMHQALGHKTSVASWTVRAPALIGETADPSCLVTDFVEGVTVDKWLRDANDALYHEHRDALAKSIALAWSHYWSNQKEVIGDVNYFNVMVDISNQEVAIIDPGMPHAYYLCPSVEKAFFPASRDLAYLAWELTLGNVRRTASGEWRAVRRRKDLFQRIMLAAIAAVSPEKEHKFRQEIFDCWCAHRAWVRQAHETRQKTSGNMLNARILAFLTEPQAKLHILGNTAAAPSMRSGKIDVRGSIVEESAHDR